MSAVETRNVTRDSFFLLADVRVEGDPSACRVKVRNLSPGGMMGEGSVRVQRGARLTVQLRNVGHVPGSVAWVQDDRFGIAFDYEIDARMARDPARLNDGNGTAPRFMAPPIPGKPAQVDPKSLRKL